MGSRMAEFPNRNSKGDGMKYQGMKMGIAKLVLLFAVRLCIWLSVVLLGSKIYKLIKYVSIF